MGEIGVDRRQLLAATAGVAAAELAGRATPAAAAKRSSQDVSGVWSAVAVSSKPGAWGPFKGVGTVNSQGSFVAGNAVQPSTCVGSWTALGGNRYRATFETFLFKHDGTPLGSLHAVVKLTRAGKTVTGTVSYQTLDTAGAVMSNGSGTVTLTRTGP